MSNAGPFINNRYTKNSSELPVGFTENQSGVDRVKVSLNLSTGSLTKEKKKDKNSQMVSLSFDINHRAVKQR